MREKDIATILLDIEAVMLNTAEPFRYTSGLLSPIYCDNRLLISYPQKRNQVINAFVQMIEEANIDYDSIAGIATAGIPHAAWIADRLQAPMIYIRNKPKEHGKKNQIEGVCEEGAQVLLVEDLVSTGGSSLAAVDAVREAGGTVMDCVAIFSYGMESAQNGFAEKSVRLHTLTNFEMLVQCAQEKEFITSVEAEKILEWNRDPKGWGKKHGYE